MALRASCERTAGIFLVTGPTGSGKSTTLYACLSHLNRPEIRILTAEDPVEYVYDEISQSEVNPDIGNTFATYPARVPAPRPRSHHDWGDPRRGNRGDGVPRRADGAPAAQHAAHEQRAGGAAAIARSRRGSVAHRVVAARRDFAAAGACRSARRAGSPTTSTPELVQEFFGNTTPDMQLVKGAGCARCHGIGYKGRALVADLWLPDQHDHLLIMSKAPFDELRKSAERTTISMAQDAHARLRDGRTTLEELARVLPYSAILEHRDPRRIRELELACGETVARLERAHEVREQPRQPGDRAAQLDARRQLTASGAGLQRDGLHGHGRRARGGEGPAQVLNGDDGEVRGRARRRAAEAVRLDGAAFRDHGRRAGQGGGARHRSLARQVLLGVEHDPAGRGVEDGL